MRFVARLSEERANVSPGSPLVELAQLVIGGLAALALLVWIAGFAIDALAVRVSPAREQRLFGALVRQVRIESSADRERLERLLGALGPVEPRPALGVVAGEELNAFALPGGAIVVTRGLLDDVDDDELSFVLAHELAHLGNRDNLRTMGRAVVLGVALAVVGLEAGPSLQLGEATGRLSLVRFGRGRERAADAEAVRRLIEHGGDGAAAVRLLERLHERETRGDRLLAWLATHPLGEERIAAARAHAGAPR
jgi:predicted Zn-dependent protease